MNNLGEQLVATASIDRARKYDIKFTMFLNECMGKFTSNDWGDTANDSVEQNNAIVNGQEGQLFAVYNVPSELHHCTQEKSIWIITEWDKSVTTILFPSDY